MRALNSADLYRSVIPLAIVEHDYEQARGSLSAGECRRGYRASDFPSPRQK